jgi:hypothetical protein
MLSQGIINARAEEQISDELRRDRMELDTILKVEARMRLDRINFITFDSKLGSALKQAAGVNDDKQLARLSSEAKEALRSHVARLLEAAGGDTKGGDLAPDLVFAVDSAGRIIGQLGSLEANPPGRSLATYPFVARALRGYLRDDVVVYDRRVYRVAARPVLSGGEYVGAIVHGYKFDNGFVERVSEGLGGASVAFFYGTNMLASFTPEKAPPVAELAAPLSDALKSEAFRKGERTAPIALASGGRASYSMIVGGAALADVGYVIGRPMRLVGSPFELFANASKQDVQALPLAWLGGAALLLTLLGLLFVYLERDRPSRALLARMSEVAQGQRDRLIVTEWRGLYRKLADAINHSIDRSVERAAEMAPASKKKANLDEILGPTPSSHVEPYFGFADAPGPPAPAPVTKPKAAQPAAAPVPVAPPMPAAAPPVFAMAAGAGAPPAGPVASAAAAPRRATQTGPNKVTAVQPPTAPARPAPNMPAPVAAAPPAPAPVSPKAAPLNMAPANDSVADPEGFDEATHFREVYAEYLSVRRECGESTEGLSYEKFENTLVKTRDQVLSKHPARGVKFTVYVKEGKAALKAAPFKK